MPRKATWTNGDDLVVGFGTHTVDNNVPAVTTVRGAVKTLQVVIDYTKVPQNTTFAQTDVAPQSAIIKRGSRILSASFVVTTAFAGTSATLNIGTWGVKTREYGITPAVDDADGIDAAIALTAIDAIGATVQCNGALVNGVTTCGAVSASDVVVSYANPTANAMTAGKGILTIEYVEPALYEGATAPVFVE